MKRGFAALRCIRRHNESGNPQPAALADLRCDRRATRIGLVVPHLMRLLVGPDRRVLLPASLLAGAALLLLADLIARLLLAPAELPIGIVTALIGAPFFLFLRVRGRS